MTPLPSSYYITQIREGAFNLIYFDVAQINVRIYIVVVLFYFWFNFYFLLFLGMVMYDNEFKTKENKF